MLDQYLRRIGWAMIGLGIVLFAGLLFSPLMDFLLLTFPPPLAAMLLALSVADAAVLPGLVLLVLGSICRDTRKLVREAGGDR